MRVIFSSFVEGDLEAIATYIARNNPVRAASFIEEFHSEFQRIGRNPELFRLRPDAGPEIRIATKGNYNILFRVDGDVVEIRRVMHGAREMPWII